MSKKEYVSTTEDICVKMSNNTNSRLQAKVHN